MNLRQRKYAICMGQLVRMSMHPTCWEFNKVLNHFVQVGSTTKNDPRRFDLHEQLHREKMRDLVEPFIPEHGSVLVVEDNGDFGFAGGLTKGSGLYTVARKKDGEIIGTFTKLEDAQAVIDKAKAAKKASLVLL